ncbi:serine/threonine-protein kinase [Calothrix sp. 336/3]|uniref:serine/threonine-protein kinase n=1 Tax=Calothrix sp. 336/3 TaxID=1337936 RepID=UPI0004E3740D|nr:serine/threonine-protein kinase [Calothrix sp. 336/3]AKG22919.1 serine/threonine protein kinase [Calothrix sp. 336/3]
MICCLNPDCPHPLNPDGEKNCRTCSTPLVPLLRNRFRVIQVLSDEGGFGRTYLAEDIDKLNERCVIKQLAPKVQENWAMAKAIELFHKEAQRLQQLGEHPQIPTLFAYFEQDNYLYLVQQFIDGHNLLKEWQQKKRYSSREIQEILLDLLPVLKFIHERGVIHRDIKPQNIIRRKSDGRLCLIDFGSSKQLTARVQFKMGTSIGSHGYSPIEQIRDGKAYPASDLFSLGATCFHLLTGTSPFQLWTEHGYSWVKNWRQFLKNPPSDEILFLLDKLLRKDIHQRYQSADQVLKDLAKKRHLPLKQSNVGEIPPPTQSSSVSRKYALLRNFFLIGSAILLLVLGEFFYRQSQQMESFVSSSVSRGTKPGDILNQSHNQTIGNFQLMRTWKLSGKSISAMAISPNGQTVMSNSDDNIKLWSVATGQEISVFSGHRNRVNALVVSPDGQVLVSGSTDRTVKLWNLARGREIRTLEGHLDSITTLAISPDGKMIADGSNDKTVRIWNLATGEVMRTFIGHSAEVSSVVFSPNSFLFATASADKTIKIWNFATGKQIYNLVGHSAGVTSLAISPDGKILASGSSDRTIRLWNLATGKQIRSLNTSAEVKSISFSPHGQILASGGDDAKIQLWNPTSGEKLYTLVGHLGTVNAVIFSEDGKTLISGSQDSTIRIWQVVN